MGHAQIRTERLHSLRIPKKSSEEAGIESEDLAFDAPVVEGDGPSHWRSIAYSLCSVSLSATANAKVTGLRDFCAQVGVIARLSVGADNSTKVIDAICGTALVKHGMTIGTYWAQVCNRINFVFHAD
jgi:hypothetical protein